MLVGYPLNSLCLLLVLLLVPSGSRADSFNRTIDDEYGDDVTGKKLEYHPSEAWQQGSTCQACVSPSAFSGTWHGASIYSPNSLATITAHFNGTGVYVYNILTPYTLPGTPASTWLTFKLDSIDVGMFFDNKIQGTTYNVLVYANDSIPFGPHTLTIQMLPDFSGTTESVALLDRIEYTTPDPPPSTRPDTTHPASPSISLPLSHLGALVGAIVGGLAVVGLVVYLVRRRRIAAHARAYHVDVHPFMATGAPTSRHVDSDAATPDAGHSSFALMEPLQEQNMETGTGTAEHSLRAEVVGLREQVMRMRELIEAPPSYHSAPDAVVRPQVQQVSPRAKRKRARAQTIPSE